MNKKKYLFIIPIILLLFSACKKNDDDDDFKVINNPELASELRNNPEYVIIDNDTLLLTSYCWRDFMPGIGGENSGLFSVSNLYKQDSSFLSENLNLVKQYVIKENEIWISKYNRITKIQDFQLEGFSKDGPYWEPDTKVDVICEFKINETVHRIIAKDQIITVVY